MKIETRPVAQKMVDEIVQRIVEVADPEKIILFGSAARGGKPIMKLDYP